MINITDQQQIINFLKENYKRESGVIFVCSSSTFFTKTELSERNGLYFLTYKDLNGNFTLIPVNNISQIHVFSGVIYTSSAVIILNQF